jgi:hypothetical protein
MGTALWTMLNVNVDNSDGNLPSGTDLNDASAWPPSFTDRGAHDLYDSDPDPSL